jgi:hypothetical protein
MQVLLMDTSEDTEIRPERGARLFTTSAVDLTSALTIVSLWVIHNEHTGPHAGLDFEAFWAFPNPGPASRCGWSLWPQP